MKGKIRSNEFFSSLYLCFSLFNVLTPGYILFIIFFPSVIDSEFSYTLLTHTHTQNSKHLVLKRKKKCWSYTILTVDDDNDDGHQMMVVLIFFLFFFHFRNDRNQVLVVYIFNDQLMMMMMMMIEIWSHLQASTLIHLIHIQLVAVVQL